MTPVYIVKGDSGKGFRAYRYRLGPDGKPEGKAMTLISSRFSITPIRQYIEARNYKPQTVDPVTGQITVYTLKGQK